MVKEAEALGRLISSREKITRARQGGDMGVEAVAQIAGGRIGMLLRNR